MPVAVRLDAYLGDRHTAAVRRRLFPPWIALLLAAAQVLGAQASADPEDGPYVLRSVDFEVTGRSLPSVLRRKIDPYGRLIGASFQGRARLEAFLEEARQTLRNERAIASVAADYEAVPSASGGYEVALHFRVTDTWNLVALPYPKYNSNTGLDLGIRLRDYNFAGSLQPLLVNLDYFLNTAGIGALGGFVSFQAPFHLGGLAWSLGINEEAKISADGSTAPASVTSAALGLEIPGLGFPATLTVTQGFSLNANGLDSSLSADPDPWFLSETLAASATIPLGPIQYVPGLSASWNWRPDAVLQYRGREGITVAFSNAFSTGRVDWKDDLREGVCASWNVSFSYGVTSADFLTDISFTVAAHATPAPGLGLAGRIVGFDRLLHGSEDDELTSLGSYMRGIADARLAGFQAVFCNLGLPVKLFDFPAHALIGRDFLDFGLQAQPFLDVGLLAPAGSRTDWFWCSGGLEILVFPGAFRSFVGRASAGLDLESAFSGGNPAFELSLGLGLLY